MHGDGVSGESGQGVDPDPDPDPDLAAQAAADYLTRLAIYKGSKDNITVTLVDLKAQRKFRIKV